MKSLFSLSLLVLLITIQGTAWAAHSFQTSTQSEVPDFTGSWKVKFTMTGLEKNVIVVAQANGVASFHFLDTGPDDKAVADLKPAIWSRLTNDRISFSGDGELPIGTCCREVGTIIFKGKFISKNSISGKLVFVTSIDEDETPYKLRSVIGTFTATRVLK